MAGHGNSGFTLFLGLFLFNWSMCLFTIGGGAWKNIHRDMGEKMGDGGALEGAGGVARAGGLTSPCERST